ncbi:cytochrome B, partial [Burkholderia multivorans]
MKAHRTVRSAVAACTVAPVLAHAASVSDPSSAPAGPLPLAYVAHAAGPAARPVFVLGWALLALCTFVCIAIAVLLL